MNRLCRDLSVSENRRQKQSGGLFLSRRAQLSYPITHAENKRAERYAKSKTNFTPTNSKAHNGFRYEPLGLISLSLITAYQILTHNKNDATGGKELQFSFMRCMI